MKLAGKISIECVKTVHSAEIEFKLKLRIHFKVNDFNTENVKRTLLSPPYKLEILI